MHSFKTLSHAGRVLNIVVAAIAYAADKHRNQRRKDHESSRPADSAGKRDNGTAYRILNPLFRVDPGATCSPVAWRLCQTQSAKQGRRAGARAADIGSACKQR